MVQVLEHRLADVTLLEEAFGAYPPPAIPGRLAEVLFGDDEGSCFALLDAARLEHLPQTLQDSDLEHACLFQGDAEQQLAEVAPWLVRVTPDNRFLRRLLTGPGTRHGLWDRDGAVFLRSHEDLAAVRRHFRRMTRLRDQVTGRWVYFRFYAAPTMRDLVAGMDAGRLRRFCGPVSRFVVPRGNASILIIDRPPGDADHADV